MGNSQNAFAEREAKRSLGKHLVSNPGKFKIAKEKAFLKRYDEVLNTYILRVFRRSLEEFDRTKDHTAIKIIGGEVVKLRLDCLQGEADGIRIFLENEDLPMYIWFRPNCTLEKITFKMMLGDWKKKELYKLEDITEDFLSHLIYKRFIATGKKLLN